VVIVSRTGALGKLFLDPPGVLQVPEKFWFRPFVFWFGPKNILGDDRALVNQAPSGLGPSGFDRSLVGQSCSGSTGSSAVAAGGEDSTQGTSHWSMQSFTTFLAKSSTTYALT